MRLWTLLAAQEGAALSWRRTGMTEVRLVVSVSKPTKNDRYDRMDYDSVATFAVDVDWVTAMGVYQTALATITEPEVGYELVHDARYETEGTA
jgi:hypothetical protein